MNYLKAIGSGLLIWIVMFAFVSAFLGFYNQYDYFKVLTIVVSGVVSLLVSYYLIKPKKIKDALAYIAIWLVIGILLDYFVTMQFNSSAFYSYFLWAGYFNMSVAPLLSLKAKKK
jgi:uncharacterized membrane protein YjjP (DUF1212 family)